MGLKRWHWGKLLMLWLLTPFVMGILFSFGDNVPVLHKPTNPLLIAVDILIVALILAVPVTMLIVTWKWLSGKEKPLTPQ